ncbi:aldehyde dehydrogenase family protein [Plantactinospora sp. GCM10030261]|uniref:aldehyde dehydrogenase family protein n=1 Tax=Plantactinospora sp. GCM10030261 TaxID=3273420 RepID=UPI00360649DE
MSEQTAAAEAVAAAARSARAASESLAAAGTDQVDAALRGMARLLGEAADPVLAANGDDHRVARAAGMGDGLLDRLRLDPGRLRGMADQLRTLANVPPEPARRTVRDLDGGLVVQEWRRPVGAIGANFEARPNVVVDIAAQLIKSRNAGVLRTGSAALGTAEALVDRVVAPALAEAGLDPAAIGLVRLPGRESAEALVRQPDLLPLVILRGSGDSTRHLAETAARAGTRTLAHADGGGVLYLHPSADRAMAADLVLRGVDRLGVCNRLNLLLVDADCWDELTPRLVDLLARREPKITAVLPPHEHPLGYEWALDDGNEATVTVAPATGPADAARIANEHTSGLAATIVAEDASAATEFLNRYVGTGGFWNATTRLLDGFKLLSVPETGINIDRVPGPRGPVTFRDLYLRQFVVIPATRAPELPPNP